MPADRRPFFLHPQTAPPAPAAQSPIVSSSSPSTRRTHCRTSSPAPSRPLVIFISSSSKKKFTITPSFPKTPKTPSPLSKTLTPTPMSNWLGKLGLGFRSRPGATTNSASASSVAQGTDDDIPARGQQFAQFGAGCFWGVELVFQGIPGVSKTEVDTLRGLRTIRVII